MNYKQAKIADSAKVAKETEINLLSKFFCELS